MIKYAHILMEAAATPWAMEPRKLAAMVGILRFAADGGKHSAAEIDARLDAARLHPNTDKSIANRPGNIALVPLRGVMSNRAPMINDVSSGSGTNMETFCSSFRAAKASDDIKAVIIDCDTPGGSCFGMVEASNEIYASRGDKPVILQVNALCASAGFCVGTACDEIVITPSGQIGSLGVYSIHEEISKMLAEMGVVETIISAGKYKTEGNPFEPLTDEARAAMQATVDAYYDQFVETVARNRGASTQAVRDGFGEGRCVTAQAAITMNMADRIGTLSETLSRWGVKLGPASRSSARADDNQAEVVAETTQTPEAPASSHRRDLAARYLEI